MLPALSLGLFNVAYNARMMRSCMLEVLAEDYIRTAQAKGLTSAGCPLRTRPQERRHPGNYTHRYDSWHTFERGCNYGEHLFLAWRWLSHLAGYLWQGHTVGSSVGRHYSHVASACQSLCRFALYLSRSEDKIRMRETTSTQSAEAGAQTHHSAEVATNGW